MKLITLTLLSTNEISRITTPNHMVDHDWSVGLPKLSYPYTWVSKVIIFHREQVGGGADRGIGDHS